MDLLDYFSEKTRDKEKAFRKSTRRTYKRKEATMLLGGVWA
jgi:hypothetical protein